MRLFFYTGLVSLILQLADATCCAQYYFRHYQTDDGLVLNSVTAILQDSKGMMWIGTRGGLNRFDGYTFKTYGDNKNKLGNIGNNAITAIAEDKKGMLWIGTGSGVFRYDPQEEIFYELQSSSHAYINGLLIDNENNLWFLANSILHKYDQQKRTVKQLNIKASCLTLDSNGDFWLGDNNGVISIYSPRNKSLTKVRLIDKKIHANLRSISKIFLINPNEALVGCFKQGLKYYNRKTGITKTLSLDQNSTSSVIYVRDITAGNDNQYWISTESGIYIYNLAKNSTTHIRKKPGDPYSLTDNAVYTACKDNRGGMWVGTFFGGLNYYSRQNARFEKYYQIPGTNSLSGDAVGEICSDNKGNLWIGTEDAGFNKLDLKTGRFTNFRATNKKGDVSYPNIHGLLAVGNKLFIGPFLHGMEIMDMRTGLITDRFRLVGPENDKASDFVISIYLTKDSTLLVGTAYGSSGLFAFNTTSKTFSRIKQIPYNSSVFHIVEDHQGNIWTGSELRGAFFYNPKTGRHGNFRFGERVGNKIINEFPIHYMLEDSNHAMWFTTIGGGLIKLSADRKTVKKFNTETGLPSNVLFGILEDNFKNLWIGSTKGLICFDLRTEKCRVYTRSNGLITDQFNYNSAHKSANGKMYFGTVKGMIAFNPAELGQKETSPPTYITGFQINNEEVIPNEKNSPLKRSILYTDTIVLYHNQNNFSIEFAALNYSSPKVTRYKYFMNGLDKDWTYLNSNRKAYFTDLSPGKYIFEVQAESNIGNWKGKERRLYIEILPPIWKSNTAYFLYILFFATALYLSVRYYHRYQQTKSANKLRLFKHEKEKEIYQAKIEFFTNIAHEIQTPLTLISVPVERVINKADDYPGIKKNLLMIAKYTKRLIDLTGQLLDFRQTEMEQFGLNFVNVNINKLLKDQVESFRELAEENHIELTLNLPASEIVAFVDREAFIKICSNLISNAIKYGASYATITLTPLKADDDYLTIHFNNDGKGISEEFRKKIFEPFFRLRSKEKPGTGIGLPLARSLTELHNGSLELTSGEHNNITFVLTLPVHQKIEFNLSSWKKIEKL
ncbi:ligand-binding sensor domain-containing protein [Arcticibacter tournemirensis]|uniref:histidine kinase n=1 Tax=Arcticibacter tournemirensis TaxID=699437 RepID=A0A4Q0M369_9SPHI|nr:sensor histidine kinase [Arcticibacter tournemirensis]RXF67337.1 sensor histidine kinase [Arcticibacter tournemirensis]